MTTVNSRAAPPTRRGQRTRQRIIDAAASMIFTQGVERTTLDAILDSAGVGKSQLYHYFGGKADLVRAVIERQTECVLDPQGPHLAPLDTWDAWQRWRDTLVEFQTARGCIGGCPLGSLASELCDVDEAARLTLARSFNRWHHVFLDGLDSMRVTGQLRADTDITALAWSILASLQGGLLLAQADKNAARLGAALDGALTTLATHLTSQEQ